MADHTWNACNIVVLKPKFPTSHPLYLEIFPKHATSLGISDKETAFTCCLRWKWASGVNNESPNFETDKVKWSNLFVTVRIKTKSDLQLQNGEGSNIIFYATDTFVQHYRLDTVSPEVGFQVKPVECVMLTSVVYYAKTTENYNFFSNSNWRNNLLLKSCKQPVLCRKNDVCLAPINKNNFNVEVVALFDLLTLDCQPVQQGLIGPNTSITIIEAPCSSKTNEIAPKSICDRELSNNRDNNVMTSQPITFVEMTNLSLSADYILMLLIPYLFHLGDMKSIKLIIKLVAQINKYRLRYHENLNVQVLIKPPVKNPDELNIDEHCSLFLTSSCLEKFNLKNSCWLKVWLNSSCSESNKKRLVKICCIEDHLKELDLSVFGEFKNDIAYVTPQLWFNLNCHPSKLVQPDVKLCLQPVMRGMKPEFAQEIHVAVVHSSSLDVKAEVDKQLKRYFRKTRLLRKDDVICLPLAKENAFNDTENELEVIYFTITKLLPENDLGLLANSMESSLYQTNSISSYLPITMNSYLTTKDFHPIWDSPLPVGLSNYTEELSEIILPYLESHNLRKNTVPTICLRGSSGCGKMTIMQSVSRLLNLNRIVLDCWDIVGESVSASETRLKNSFQKAILCSPCMLILKNIHVLLTEFDGPTSDLPMVYKFQDALQEFLAIKQPVIIVGLTNNLNFTSSELGSAFIHHINVEALKETKRINILSVLLRQNTLALETSLSEIAKSTSGYVLGDLVSLVSRAIESSYERACVIGEDDVHLAGTQILPCDFDKAFAEMQLAQSEAMGASTIPKVKWEDVGGLEDLKLELMNSVKLPLENPELLASGFRRSGILFYGPPGTGKTLLAKAVATEFSMNFISVKGPELLSMYVGQSEENVRKVFQKARDASPVIVFFDEMDSLAPNRGRSGDSGGVMDRVVSQLLAEIDGLNKSKDVFVMAATNRPDLIDPALLRPGRFDKLLYVGISEDRASQVKILKALTRKFTLGKDVDLNVIIEKCPLHLTGADFYAICSDALLGAVARKIDQQDVKDGGEEDEDIIVNLVDFMSAIDNLVPSISPETLQSYSAMARRWR